MRYFFTAQKYILYVYYASKKLNFLKLIFQARLKALGQTVQEPFVYSYRLSYYIIANRVTSN